MGNGKTGMGCPNGYEPLEAAGGAEAVKGGKRETAATGGSGETVKGGRGCEKIPKPKTQIPALLNAETQREDAENAG